MLHPDDTFELLIEPDNPDGPALTVSVGTAGDWREYARRFKSLTDADGDDYIDGIVDLINSRVVARRDLPEDLAGVLTQGRLFRIARRLPLEAELSETDQGNSASPSRSPAAASAESAEAATTAA